MGRGNFALNTHTIKGVTAALPLFPTCHEFIARDHSFPQTTEFRAEPRNLSISAEFVHFHGISMFPQNLVILGHTLAIYAVI